jgi:hypothetical protein
MFKDFISWLKDPSNQELLKLIGAAIAFLWTAGWGVWVYLHPPVSNDDKKKAVPPLLPARDRPNNRKSKPVRSVAALALPFSAWVAGLVVVGGAWYGWQTYFAEPPTVTVQFRLCLGEYERNCGFDHDVYLYCYTDVDEWARGRCLRHTATSVGSHDGNKCGYTNVSVVCTQKKP